MRVFSLDLRSIALVRIAMGLLILIDLAIRCQDISAFYVADGILPVNAMPSSHLTHKHLELYRWVDNFWGVAALMGVAAVFAGSLTLGFYSRTSALISWYLLASLQNRNIYLNDGGDLTLRIFLFISIFLPLGARWSVDAWRNPQWKSLPNQYFSPASVAIVVQTCVMYFTAGILKNDPVWRETGDALYLALSMDQFSTSLAQQLLHHPGLCRALSFVALGIELTTPLLLLCPLFNHWTRLLSLLLLTCFHLGVASCMHLGLFMPICLAVLLYLVPTQLMDRLERRLPAFPERKSDRRSTAAPSGYKPSWFGRWFPVTIIVFILVQNTYTIEEVQAAGMKAQGGVLKAILGYGRSTALMQNWTLFAPRPQTVDGWFVVEGITADGRVFDVLTNQLSTYAKPASVAAQFRNQRWRRHFQNLWLRYNPRHIPLYLRWTGRRWNREHAVQDRFVSMRLVFVQEVTQLPGIPQKAEPFTLGEFPSPYLEGETL